MRIYPERNHLIIVLRLRLPLETIRNILYDMLLIIFFIFRACLNLFLKICYSYKAVHFYKY